MAYNEKEQRKYLEEVVNAAHERATRFEAAQLLLLSEILNELTMARKKQEIREAAYVSFASYIPKAETSFDVPK